ncbi:hypothetical protein ACSS6W_010986 [Trichoderma asperelloides]|nr:FAD/NAD(P)-binding domain-containing protein [Trichoderma asperelloides]
MSAPKFKVIIAGAGPVGLSAAHALRLANIDFLVLEKRQNVVIDVGASLAVGPASMRVMHQLGLLESLLEASHKSERRKALTIDGRLVKDTPFYHHLKNNTGSTSIAFNRVDYLRLLYERLGSDHAKVLTGKDIVDIISSNSGVTVKCADGTIYEGSIVIGADGAHSKVRSIMRQMALEEDPTRSWDAESPFLTTYKCLWFSTPSLLSEQDLSGCPDMTVYETYHKDHSIMCLSGKLRCWTFLYKKLPQPTTQRLTYTKEDMEEMVNTFADFPITEFVKVGEAYNKRINSSMASIEEGMTRYWSWGRIVLAGDSCHKFAPNLGLGYQSGLQDVVALCNRLYSAVAQAPDGIPGTLALSQVFQSYHAFRQGPANIDAKLSAFLIRLTVWANFFHYFLSLYILPSLLADHILQNWIFPPIDRRMLVLDYVESEEPFAGRVSWIYKIPTTSKEKED